jgi:DNA-binding NtrC family response regulator
MAIALCGDRDILYPRDLGMAEPVTPKVISIDVRTPSAPLTQGVDFDTAVTRFQLSMLQEALTQTGGNKTAAAELLGMKRTTLIMKLRNFEGIAV